MQEATCWLKEIQLSQASIPVGTVVANGKQLQAEKLLDADVGSGATAWSVALLS